MSEGRSLSGIKNESGIQRDGKSLKKLVGGGYEKFWRFKGRYRVIKGSRGSKKSKTTALNIIARMMAYHGANTLVVRKVYRTLKDSCFAELKWAAARLGADKLWSASQSPLEMTYLPTGQRIIFRGLDDSQKITSITVETGILCWLWIEEAYEISREDDFDMLDEALRGSAEGFEKLFKQATLTFNPWSERHWLKKRFFDKQDKSVLAATVNYLQNEWLDAADREMFERMKERNPQRYRVAGLGEWGLEEGLIYPKVREKEFSLDEAFWVEHSGAKTAFGLDFGYAHDPSALFCAVCDMDRLEIYVFDELYQKGLNNRVIAEKIRGMGYGGDLIYADCAEPKSIAELRELGLYGVTPARKGPDSVRNGIQFIQGFEIFVNPRCVNFLREVYAYAWDTDGKPRGGDDHLMDAMRYALERFSRGDTYSF